MAGAVARVARAVWDAVDLADVHFYGGLALIGWGAWQCSPAAGAITVGVILMLSNLSHLLTIVAARRKE